MRGVCISDNFHKKFLVLKVGFGFGFGSKTTVNMGETTATAPRILVQGGSNSVQTLWVLGRDLKWL